MPSPLAAYLLSAFAGGFALIGLGIIVVLYFAILMDCRETEADEYEMV